MVILGVILTFRVYWTIYNEYAFYTILHVCYIHLIDHILTETKSPNEGQALLPNSDFAVYVINEIAYGIHMLITSIILVGHWLSGPAF